MNDQQNYFDPNNIEPPLSNTPHPTSDDDYYQNLSSMGDAVDVDFEELDQHHHQHHNTIYDQDYGQIYEMPPLHPHQTNLHSPHSLRQSVLEFARDYDIAITGEIINQLHLPNGLLDHYVNAQRPETPREEIRLRQQGFKDAVGLVYDLNDDTHPENIKARKGVEIYNLTCDAFCDIDNPNDPNARNIYHLLTGHEKYFHERTIKQEQEKKKELELHSNFMDWDSFVANMARGLGSILIKQKNEAQQILSEPNIHKEWQQEQQKREQKAIENLSRLQLITNMSYDDSQENIMPPPLPPLTTENKINHYLQNPISEADSSRIAKFDPCLSDFDHKRTEIENQFKLHEVNGLPLTIDNPVQILLDDVKDLAYLHAKATLIRENAMDDPHLSEMLKAMYERLDHPSRLELANGLNNQGNNQQRYTAHALNALKYLQQIENTYQTGIKSEFVEKLAERSQELTQENKFLKVLQGDNTLANNATYEVENQARYNDNETPQEPKKGFISQILGR